MQRGRRGVSTAPGALENRLFPCQNPEPRQRLVPSIIRFEQLTGFQIYIYIYIISGWGGASPCLLSPLSTLRREAQNVGQTDHNCVPGPCTQRRAGGSRKMEIRRAGNRWRSSPDGGWRPRPLQGRAPSCWCRRCVGRWVLKVVPAGHLENGCKEVGTLGVL